MLVFVVHNLKHLSSASRKASFAEKQRGRQTMFPKGGFALIPRPKTKRMKMLFRLIKPHCRDFPGGAVVKNPPANAGDTGSIPGPGRSHMPQSN